MFEASEPRTRSSPTQVPRSRLVALPSCSLPHCVRHRHVGVRNLERFSSRVHFLFDVLGNVAFWKRTSLQHAGAKFPAAVDEMARGVVALSRLRCPSIRGESNELCFPFEELGQFLPPGVVTFLHQGSDVGAGWNGVKEQAENPFESSIVYNAQRPHVSDALVNQQICYLRIFCCRARSRHAETTPQKHQCRFLLAGVDEPDMLIPYTARR